MAKPKTLLSKAIDAMHIVGDELLHFEQSKLLKKVVFDRNVVTHVHGMEHILDYAFAHLGINQKIEMPLVFVEPLGNPNYCRKQSSELFFEGYDLPAVAYTVDALAGFYFQNSNDARLDDGLVIQSGGSNTILMPILDGKFVGSLTKRIPIGGQHHTDLLAKIMGLKYP